jgi:uncharacterized protein YxjI
MDQNQVPPQDNPVPAQQSAAPTNRVALSVERQFAQLIGTNIRTFDAGHNLIAFAKAKAFKIREEVNFYSDEAQTQPLFKTKARNIIDLAPTFDMFTSEGQIFGSLKRQGLMSAFARDHWLILDATGNQVGEIVEDSLMMGILRRNVDFVSLFVPQTYSVTFGDKEVAEIKQRKNPFTVKYDYAIDEDQFTNYRMLFLAIANLLALIEARQ